MGKKFIINSNDELDYKEENESQNYFEKYLNNENPYSGNYFFGKPINLTKTNFLNTNFFKTLKSISKKNLTEFNLIENTINDIIIEETKTSELKIKETLCSANLGCKLNLKLISKKYNIAEYNPRRFNSLILRTKNPKSICLIFSNGKILCTGTKSSENCKKSILKYSQFLINIGYPIIINNFTVENIVAYFKFEYDLNIEKINENYKNECKYIPELFSGLIFKKKKSNIIFLIFTSGIIIITGAKSRKEIIDSYEYILYILNKIK